MAFYACSVLTRPSITQYFRELGCRISAPSKSGQDKQKPEKAPQVGVKVAKLKLPLDFPKQRVIMPKQRL